MEQKQTALWIWYPGDFEIWQHQKISLRRRDRSATVPAFWKLDPVFISVKFRKRVILDRPEKIFIRADGKFTVHVDNARDRDFAGSLTVPAGEHELVVCVGNQNGLPSIFVQGETIISDAGWEVWSYQDDWQPAGFWNMSDSNVPPSKFQLPVKEIFPTGIDRTETGWFLDFGQEVYASLKLSGLAGFGRVSVSYGESVEEAKDTKHCVLLDDCVVEQGETERVLSLGAFRYAWLRCDDTLDLGRISALFEYLPLDYRGAFSCSDERLNRIWEVSRYTLHLNTREFFLDGIKRDGWVWSGDAYQSFLLNYYVFFDEDVTRRTLTALRGKDPVTAHINTIMDYTFYWFLGLYDYYLYTGDLAFLKQTYPKMLSLMEFCLHRRNQAGMMEGLPGDWVYIDWADFDHRGEVSAEQFLFCRSLEVMGTIATLTNDPANSDRFNSLANELRQKLVDLFWNDSAGGLVTTRIDGVPSSEVTRHANIFALLFDFLDPARRERVIQSVLLNPDVQNIKTPYFRFYELAALCEAGQIDHVRQEILDYWGGMLDLGATTFWEEFDPAMRGPEHYAMYGEPFDKSLCHAWGAAPIYLLGRYFLGVRPLSPGYATFEVRPQLAGLDHIRGTVPTPNGEIRVYMDSKTIRITTTANQGLLLFQSKGKTPPSSSLGKIRRRPESENEYEILLDQPGEEYLVSYTR
jgi:alpha-L-rhamnosidase